MLKRLTLLMLLATQAAGAQTSLVGDTQDMRGGAPTSEQARIEAIRSNLDSMTNNYNILLRSYNQYKRCGNMGMAYAPNGSASIPGWVSATKCAPLAEQPIVREVRFTTAVTRGDMGSGATAAAKMTSFMNAQGCPTSIWHPCTEEELRYAFAKNLDDINTTSFTYAWFMGSDLQPARQYTSPAFNLVNNPYCDYWSSSTAGKYGYAVALYNGTSNGKGLTLMDCSNFFPVACCR